MLEIIEIRTPGPPLDEYVDRLWYYEVDDRPASPDRLLAHGAFELVISLSGESGESLISGPHIEPMVVDPDSLSPLVGAHFKPGGAAALLGYPARDFVNLDVPLDDILARRSRSLHARLCESRTLDHALAVLERELTEHLPHARSPHPAVSMAIAEFHTSQAPRPIRDLVDDSGLSQRRFIEVFANRVGLTPKRYARIQRFQRVLTRINRRPVDDWCQVAYEFGYSDQAHMIREFREFAGLRPTEYAPRWPDHPNHVPLP